MTTPVQADIETTLIELAAGGVSSTSFGAGSSSQSAMSIDDLIKADRYLSSKKARQRRACGMTFRQIVPPGAVNDA